MNQKIDFDKYSLDELYDSARNIDREKYPDLAVYIDSLIEEKESQLPNAELNRYYCNKNYINLLNGVLIICICVYILYSIDLGSLSDSEFRIAYIVLIFSSVIACIYFAFKYIEAYIKLFGVERFIEIENGILSMPKNSFSLEYVDIPISSISKLNYRSFRGAFGVPAGLVITHGQKEKASFAIWDMAKNDFYTLCDQLHELVESGKDVDAS